MYSSLFFKLITIAAIGLIIVCGIVVVCNKFCVIDEVVITLLVIFALIIVGSMLYVAHIDFNEVQSKLESGDYVKISSDDVIIVDTEYYTEKDSKLVPIENIIAKDQHGNIHTAKP